MDIEDLKNLNTEEILNLDVNTLNHLTKGNRNLLANIVSKVVSTANKRIKRLGKTDIGQLSPAYKSYLERGRKFSVRGKNINELRNELSVASNFLRYKTSTLSGWKSLRQDVERNIGKMTPYKSRKFWKTYRKLAEMDNGIVSKGHVSSRGSDRIQRLLHQEFTDKGWRKKPDDIIQSMEKKIKYIYLKEQSGEKVSPEDVPDLDDVDYDELEDIINEL